MKKRASGRAVVAAWALVMGAGVAAPAWADDGPPVVTSRGWEAWYQRELASRIAASPRERAVTFYFSQAGSDATGDGTQANPWRSLAKAQAVINARPAGNFALLFRRGDVWRETAGLFTSAPGVTIADYGAGAKPLFTAFLSVGAASGWSPVPGFAQVYVRTMPETVSWVKEDDDLDTPYVRLRSVAAVAGEPGSFWFDPSGARLYVRPKLGPGGVSTDPRVDGKPYEYVAYRDAGVVAQGDGSRIENIRAWGWGMHPVIGDSQRQGIMSEARGTARVLAIGCESYYQSSHAIAHLNAQYGGIATFVRCRAGLTNFNVAGETVFNTFSNLGGNSTFFHECVATHGTLPSSEWDYRGGRRGVAFYGHTGAAPGQYMGVTVAYGCRISDTRWGCVTPAGFGDMPPAPTLRDARAFIVGEVFEGGPGTGPGLWVLGTGNARVNCRYENVRPTSMPWGALQPFAAGGWLINSTIGLDLSGLPAGTYALFDAQPGAQSRVGIWHSAITVNVPAGTTFVLDGDGQSPASTLVNCVLTKVGAGTAVANVGGPSGGAMGNAGAGFAPGPQTPDPMWGTLAWAPALGGVPSCGSPLACSAAPLPGGVRLEYDLLGNGRRSPTARGPRQTQACGDCDGSTSLSGLNVLDFACFLREYREGLAKPLPGQVESVANCDGSTVVPVLNTLDFACFLRAFRAGCP